VVRQSTTSLASPQQRVRLDCPACGRRAKARDWRARRVRTVCGPIRFERPWYVCAACRHGWSPADATLGLPPRARLSDGLRAWVMEVGVETTFKRGERQLRRLTGQAV
jgi:hypothetical protein